MLVCKLSFSVLRYNNYGQLSINVYSIAALQLTNFEPPITVINYEYLDYLYWIDLDGSTIILTMQCPAQSYL